MIESLLMGVESLARTVTAILAHSLWQGALISLLLFAALSMLRLSSARFRYALCCCAMLVFVTAVTVTACALRPGTSPTGRQAPAVADQPIGSENGSDQGPSIGTPVIGNDVSPTPAWWGDRLVRRYIFMIWITGVLLYSAYHFLGWRRARGFIRRGTSPPPLEWRSRLEELCLELRIRKVVTLLRSSLVRVPCVVGWMKPVVLVPASMFTMLSPSEMEMILVHELAHIRRYDVLINIMQTAV